ncbi:hypothetical protein [Rubritalea tangerina]|uniref:hypothetical protein n=1 Tax=Rubritalea tangerina TaxID=430798 RepID=UPI00361E8A9A
MARREWRSLNDRESNDECENAGFWRFGTPLVTVGGIAFSLCGMGGEPAKHHHDFGR